MDDTLSVNSLGETYCSLSAATAEKHPDLVAAVGTEGQSGYVRYENLISVDERIFTGKYAGRYIPLYDLEGNNIGTFFIEYSQPDIIGKDIETVRAELSDSTAQNPALWALADRVLVNGKYPVNSKGQTYGSSSLRKIAGHSPDLIPAVPAEENNGVAGYIRCVKELPISEEEVMARCAATSEPLYDVDGNVIGTFEWKSEPVRFYGKTVPDVQVELADGPANEVSSEAFEASNEIQPRDAVLFYRQNVTSIDGNVIASIELGVDTRNNEIIDIHRLFGIERVNSDYYITQLSGAEIISERYSLDRTSVE